MTIDKISALKARNGRSGARNESHDSVRRAYKELSFETIRHDRCPRLQLMESFSASAWKKSPNDTESKFFYHEGIQRNWQLKIESKWAYVPVGDLENKLSFYSTFLPFHTVCLHGAFDSTAAISTSYTSIPYCHAWLISKFDIISGLSRLLLLFRVSRSKDFNERTTGELYCKWIGEFFAISRVRI